MGVLTKAEFRVNKNQLINSISNGALYIHPTDTIYGIGCDATNSEAVKKIRLAKERYTRPFSIIAPSKEWIMENCIVTKDAELWLRRLPGPYTLILKLKNKKAVAKEVNPGLDSIGVRIPDHWIKDVAEEISAPLVTTSANIVGKNFMTSIDNLDSKIKNRMDFIVYEGEKNGRPSTIVDLTEDKEKIIER